MGIVCAQARSGTVVNDDRAGRDACSERRRKKTGTIGILKTCCLDSPLSLQEADEVLQEMVAAGFYSPVSRISDTLQRPKS